MATNDTASTPTTPPPTSFEIPAGMPDSPTREMPPALRQRLSTSPKKPVTRAEFESRMQRATEAREAHLQTAAQKAAAVAERAAAVASKSGGGVQSGSEAKKHELLEQVAAADARRQAKLEERRTRAGAHSSHVSRAAEVVEHSKKTEQAKRQESLADSQAQAAVRRQAVIDARCETAAAAAAAAKAKADAARSRAREQVEQLTQSLTQSQAEAAARLGERQRAQLAQLEAAATHRAEVQARRAAAAVPVA